MNRRRRRRRLGGLADRRGSLAVVGVALALIGTTAFWTANTGAVDSNVQIVPGLPKGGKAVKIEQFAGGANAANSTGGIPTVQNGVALARITVPAGLANKVRVNITWTNPQQVRTLFRSRNAWITLGLYHMVHKDACLGDSGPYNRWTRWGNQASVTQTVYEGPELVLYPGTWREQHIPPKYCALLDVGSTGSPSVGGSWHDPGQGALLLTNKAPSGYLIPSLSFSSLGQCPAPPILSGSEHSWPHPDYWGAPGSMDHDDDAYAVDSFLDPPVTGTPGACSADSLLDISATGVALNSSNPPLVTYGTGSNTRTQSAALYLVATVATSGGWSWTADDAAQLGSMQFFIRGKLMR
jgi:hypothetical protein